MMQFKNKGPITTGQAPGAIPNGASVVRVFKWSRGVPVGTKGKVLGSVDMMGDRKAFGYYVRWSKRPKPDFLAGPEIKRQEEVRDMMNKIASALRRCAKTRRGLLAKKRKGEEIGDGLKILDVHENLHKGMLEVFTGKLRAGTRRLERANKIVAPLVRKAKRRAKKAKVA